MLKSVFVLSIVLRAIGILVYTVTVPFTILVVAVKAAAINIIEVAIPIKLTILVITYASRTICEFHQARSVSFAVFQWTFVNTI